MRAIFRLAHILGALLRRHTEKQQWLDEAPSEKLIAEDSKLLKKIPIDGVNSTVTIEDSSIKLYFCAVKTNNQAIPFATLDKSSDIPNYGSDAIFTINYKNGYDYRDLIISDGIIENNKTLRLKEVTKDTLITINEDHSKEHHINLKEELVNNINIIESKRCLYFYFADILSTATKFITNIPNGKKEIAEIGKDIKIPITYAIGYDCNDIKCTGCRVDNSYLYIENIESDLSVKIEEADIYHNTFKPETEIISPDIYIESSAKINFLNYVIITNKCTNIVNLASNQATVRNGESIKITATFKEGYGPNNISLTFGTIIEDEDNTYYFYIENVDEDYRIILEESPESIISVNEEDILGNNVNITSGSITECLYNLYIKNETEGLMTFDESFLVNNLYAVYKGNDFDFVCYYKTGFGSEDIAVTDGYITLGIFKVEKVLSNRRCIFTVNQEKLPIISSDDDILNIFNDEELRFKNAAQYKIIKGDDSVLTHYSYITDQPENLNDRNIWWFDNNIIDLYNFDSSNIPGNVITNLALSSSKSNELVEERFINNHKLYRHFVTLKEPFKLENNRCCIIPIRSGNNSSVDNLIIAATENTAEENIVNVFNSPVKDASGKFIFNWDENNKFIYSTNMHAYFAINGKRV